MDIETKASEYAEQVRTDLIREPIKGVEPIVTANAHRIGFKDGATAMQAEKDREIEELRQEVLGWKGQFLITFILLIMMFFLLIFTLYNN